MIYCDNVRECHEPKEIGEDLSAVRVICVKCKKQEVIRKDINKGTPEIRQYAKFFKKDILQGNDNLFYKYHDEHIIK